MGAAAPRTLRYLKAYSNLENTGLSLFQRWGGMEACRGDKMPSLKEAETLEDVSGVLGVRVIDALSRDLKNVSPYPQVIGITTTLQKSLHTSTPNLCIFTQYH